MTDAGVDDPLPFGRRLRRLRESAGLTQAALAGDNLHPSYVSLIESGRRAPTHEALTALAARLNLSVAELVGEPEVEIAGPLALAEAALGLGRSDEALDLLAPYVGQLSLQVCTARSTMFRAALTYATALERVNRIKESVGILEMLLTAAESSPSPVDASPVAVALVRCYRDVGDLGRAIDVGEAARAKLLGTVTIEHNGHVALVSTLASAYAERGDLLRAQLLLEDLLDDDATGLSLDDQARTLWNAAITAVERGDGVEGLRLADQAALLLSLGTNLGARARVQVARAWVLLAQPVPRAEEARDVLRLALPQLRQHAPMFSVASAETELARAELVLSRPEVARRHAASALKHLGPEHSIERARALTALAAAVWALGSPRDAASFLGEAGTLLESSQAPRQAAAVWRQLAEVYRTGGDFERALAAADKAMDAAGLARQAMVGTPSATPARSRTDRAHLHDAPS
jgi:transcriptional regulator with XRE-family HTH domain